MTDEAILVYYTDCLKNPPDSGDPGHAMLYKLVHNYFSENWPIELYGRMKQRDSLTKEKLKELYKLGEQYVDNYKKYGCTTWYDWCCVNWGTKWNACDATVDRYSPNELAYQFNTAWSEPRPVIEALAKKYPKAVIEHTYSYEDDYDPEDEDCCHEYTDTYNT